MIVFIRGNMQPVANKVKTDKFLTKEIMRNNYAHIAVFLSSYRLSINEHLYKYLELLILFVINQCETIQMTHG